MIHAPPYDARLRDLGPRDLVKITCTGCSHIVRMVASHLEKHGIHPYGPILTRKRRLRCTRCHSQGHVDITIRVEGIMRYGEERIWLISKRAISGHTALGQLSSRPELCLFFLTACFVVVLLAAIGNTNGLIWFLTLVIAIGGIFIWATTGMMFLWASFALRVIFAIEHNTHVSSMPENNADQVRL